MNIKGKKIIAGMITGLLLFGTTGCSDTMDDFIMEEADNEYENDVEDAADEYEDDEKQEADNEYENNKDKETIEFDEDGTATYNCYDGSMIIFDENGEFIWYKSPDDLEDNYYIGKYEIYMSEEALDYIVNDLEELGVTEDEMDDYFERNKGNDFYNLDNYCCLVLNNEMALMDGEEKPMDTSKYYMGFGADGTYDLANMQTGNLMGLTREYK